MPKSNIPSTKSFLFIIGMFFVIGGLFNFMQSPVLITGMASDDCIPTFTTCNDDNVYQHYENCDGENIEYCQNGCSGGACASWYNTTPTPLPNQTVPLPNQTKPLPNQTNPECIPTATTCNGNYVYQHYENCGGQNIQYCPYGCSGGACVSFYNTTPKNTTNGTTPETFIPTSACIDSDGGKNYFQKGTLVAYTSDAPFPIMKVDYCINSNKLREMYCDNSVKNFGSLPKEESYVCPNECQNGACVVNSTNSTPSCIPTYTSCNGNYVYQHYENCGGQNKKYCPYGCDDGLCVSSNGTAPPSNQTAPPTPNSCQNSCGAKSGNCWCDSICVMYGDCCSDYDQECGGTGLASSPSSSSTNSGSCQNMCGVNSGSCWCDVLCKKYGDCCPDYAEKC
ncbi:MAG: hypothetical protein WC613_00750 [Candidatus Aenigmatarchaeota archaeon]